MENRGFLQISFQWLFAIIVGIFILFLTIYGVIRLIGVEEEAQGVVTSVEIGVLLNPLETGFEEAKSGIIEFDSDTRIYADCDDFGNFGKQSIALSQKSFGKWSERSESVDFYNKYIFSEYPVEAKKVYLFSKPFEFPFKVANLIYMIPAEKVYCFIDAPGDIEDELENLNIENLKIENCSESGYINICFKSGEKCDINVNYVLQSIEKQEDKVFFEGDALMYGGIFSDPLVYECQVKRLMKRVESLVELYQNKADIISASGCYSNINTDLQLLISGVQSLDNSIDLLSIDIRDINIKNNNAQCRLW